MGKVDDRRKKLAEFIKKMKSVSRKDICEEFKIKDNTLTGDLKQFRLEGLPIVNPKRSGMVIWEEKSVLPNHLENSSVHYDDLKASHIRELMILYALHDLSGDSDISKEEIKNRIFKIFRDEEEDIERGKIQINGTKVGMYIENDLLNLESKGLICVDRTSSVHFIYSLSEKASNLYKISYDILSDFIFANKRQQYEGIWSKEIKFLFDRASFLLDDPADDAYIKHRNIGRVAYFSTESYDSLQQLLKCDYKAHKLRFEYQSAKNNQITEIGELAGIVQIDYFNEVYLLYYRKNKYHFLPLQKITNISQDKSRNEHWNCNEANNIMTEMFYVSTEDPMDVIVRFRNTQSNVRKRIENLCEARKATAKIEDKDDYYIYTDRIRGIDHFSSFIKSFGSLAIVDQPLKLREQILKINCSILKNYEEE